MNLCKDCKFCKFPAPKIFYFLDPTLLVCRHPKYKYIDYSTGKEHFKDAFCEILRRHTGPECDDFISKH